jgi:hypothetical protein
MNIKLYQLRGLVCLDLLAKFSNGRSQNGFVSRACSYALHGWAKLQIIPPT